ncbi:MAG: hypothetical protein LC109_03430, partial [Bacteroidia bacterium]|nr:hypothetical protein [Bacteroidia bacterium]
MKYSLFFISVLIYLTNCNSNQTTQNSVDELITVESNNFDSNYITKPMERNFDSISFKWGEKRNIAVKDDSLLYFTIQSPTVLKYYTQTRYNYV